MSIVGAAAATVGGDGKFSIFGVGTVTVGRGKRCPNLTDHLIKMLTCQGIMPNPLRIATQKRSVDLVSFWSVSDVVVGTGGSSVTVRTSAAPKLSQ